MLLLLRSPALPIAPLGECSRTPFEFGDSAEAGASASFFSTADTSAPLSMADLSALRESDLDEQSATLRFALEGLEAAAREEDRLRAQVAALSEGVEQARLAWRVCV